MTFRTAPGQRPTLNRSTALTLALGTRATLRNALRAAPDAPEAERSRLTGLRHRMLGKLNQSGSGVNVSAAYGPAEHPELRIAVALKHGGKDDASEQQERTEVMKAFSAALREIGSAIDPTGYRLDAVGTGNSAARTPRTRQHGSTSWRGCDDELRTAGGRQGRHRIGRHRRREVELAGARGAPAARRAGSEGPGRAAQPLPDPARDGTARR